MLSEEDSKPTNKIDEFPDKFIEEYIESQKAKIATRKLIQEMLFFASCQVASASLALVLFQFAVQVVFTTWLCLFVAWLPSLNGLTEVNFKKTDDGWNLNIMNKPIVTIIKFVSSIGIVSFTVYSVNSEITRTVNLITEVYTEIQQYEQPKLSNFLPPYLPQVVLASVGIVLLVKFFRGGRDY